MRIVVDPPEVLLAAWIILGALAIHFPVRNAIDCIGIWLFVGLLQAAPDKCLDVCLEGIDLLLRWIKDVLAREIWGFPQGGVIRSHGIRLKPIEIVWAAQNLMFHVPLRKNGSVPFRGVV